jgi:hypothetical protein
MVEYFHLPISDAEAAADRFFGKRDPEEVRLAWIPKKSGIPPYWWNANMINAHGRAGMSAKFYNMIAKSIRETEMPKECKAALVSNLSAEFTTLNPRFNPLQFLAACMSSDRAFIKEMKERGTG